MGPEEYLAGIWYRGRVTALAPPPFPPGRAVAFNNRGWVAGTGVDEQQLAVHGYLWRSRTVIDIGALGVGHTWPADINERGQIVGITGVNDGLSDPVPFLWSDGAMTDLRTLGLPELARVGAINDRGVLGGRTPQGAAVFVPAGRRP